MSSSTRFPKSSFQNGEEERTWGEGESPKGPGPGRERGTTREGTLLFLKLLSVANSLGNGAGGGKSKASGLVLQPTRLTAAPQWPLCLRPGATGREDEEGTGGQAAERRRRTERAPSSAWPACQFSARSCFTSVATPARRPQPCRPLRASQGRGPGLHAPGVCTHMRLYDLQTPTLTASDRGARNACCSLASQRQILPRPWAQQRLFCSFYQTRENRRQHIMTFPEAVPRPGWLSSRSAGLGRVP